MSYNFLKNVYFSTNTGRTGSVRLYLDKDQVPSLFVKIHSREWKLKSESQLRFNVEANFETMSHKAQADLIRETLGNSPKFSKLITDQGTDLIAIHLSKVEVMEVEPVEVMEVEPVEVMEVEPKVEVKAKPKRKTRKKVEVEPVVEPVEVEPVLEDLFGSANARMDRLEMMMLRLENLIKLKA